MRRHSETGRQAANTLQQRRSETTRRQLLRTARQLFAERGYGGTSMEQVAVRAGMSRGALYHQFRNKQTLFEAVLDATAEAAFQKGRRISLERAEDVGGGRTSWERLSVVFELALDAFLDPTLRRLLLVDGPAVLGPKACRRIMDAHFLDRVRGGFRNYEQAGVIDPSVPEMLPELFFAAVLEAGSRIPDADDPVETRRKMGEALAWLGNRLRPLDAAT